MSGITIPTLDEITGHTVMAKLRSLCKRFIGLAEEVDEKIDAPLEEAHLAVQTANATLATAQESLENANSAVTTANSASATANEASESAQESAETVAGYDTRLTNIENSAVKTSGNQVISGKKTFVTSSPLELKATSGYNNLYICARGQSQTIEFDRYNSDSTQFDKTMVIGSIYNNGNSQYMGMICYSPRTNIGDNDEPQYNARLVIRSNKDGTATVYLTAVGTDNLGHDKILGTFNGTTWS